MSRFRTTIKLTFALLAVWLGLVWAGLLPRPAILPPELDIEPLTYLLGAVAATLFIFWKNNDAKSEAAAASHHLTEPDESLQAEIRKYLKSRYEHRIRQKLAGREPVNLRKIPSSTGTSDEAAQNFITLPAEKVPSGMAELFDEARGRLLVVGAPGAGKTTLLLQLALALLERPGKDLPVLLNLATWRSEFADFDDWLQRILPLELGASKALAEKIRRNTPLILLLDGLDEVPEDARASCLKAIGEYGAEAKHRFVISSRIAEYAATVDVRNIELEIEVAPLTLEQVKMNLTAQAGAALPGAKPLLNAFDKDPLLREAIANPFYLNTAQLLFATGRKYSDFGFSATDVAGRHRELVERFVEDALERKVKREYPKEKARKWLGFLAGKMKESGKVKFELADVWPDWTKKAWSVGVFSIFLCSIFLSLPFFAFQISIGATAKSLGVGRFRYQNFDEHYSYFDIFSDALYDSLEMGVLFGIPIGLYIIFTNKKFNLSRIEWAIILLICIIVSLTVRHDNIFLSILAWIVIILSFNHTSKTYKRLFRTLNPYSSLWVSLKEGHPATFIHFPLRLAVALESSLPLRLVTFLNEMSLRYLLEFEGDPVTGKGGGAWRWRHRIIQEYFLEARGEK